MSRLQSTRIRFVCGLNPRVRADLLADPHREVSFLPMEAIGEDGSLNLSQTRLVDAVKNGYSYFEDGDVTFAKVTPCFENGKGALMQGLLGGAGFGTTELTVLRAHSREDSRYLRYVLLSEAFKQEGAACMLGAGGLKRVPDEFTKDFKIAWPSPSERLQIANFLDERTARIDALIAEKERLRTKLDESLFSLTYDAVTKGLKKDAYKPSGREWIGDIPAHWESPFIRYVARIESGHTPSRQHPEYWENCSIPWFTLGDVWQLRDGVKEVVTETQELVSELGLANSSARLLPAGTVMLSRTASVGFSGIMGVDMATTQDFVNWVCGPKVIPEYLLYVLRAMSREFERLKYGSTHHTIYMPDIAKLSMPLPPLKEQQEIVAYIRARKERIIELATSISTVAAALREYRTSLISAAVAGRLDVETGEPYNRLEQQTEKNSYATRVA